MASGVANTPELTAAQVQKILVQPLEKASVFLRQRPRIFDSDGNQVKIPKLTTASAPAWTAENVAITESDPDFGEVTLLPSTMKSVKTITRFSNELARQSVIALDAALRDRLVKDVADTLDTAFIASTVTDGTQPTGITNVTGVQTITAVGAFTNFDKFHDAVGLAMEGNVDIDNLRWLMHSRDFKSIRKLKDTTNRYQLQPDPTGANRFVLLGYPVAISNRIPINLGVGTNESKIVLADWSQIAVARDQSPTVKVLDQTYADFDQLAVRVTARYDMKPLNAQAIVRLEGITP